MMSKKKLLPSPSQPPVMANNNAMGARPPLRPTIPVTGPPRPATIQRLPTMPGVQGRMPGPSRQGVSLPPKSIPISSPATVVPPPPPQPTFQANPLVAALNILGLPASASLDEVKVAYRRLAKRHHPDKGGDPQFYRNIEWAYQTLFNSYQEWNSQSISDQNQLRNSAGRQEFNVPNIIAPDKYNVEHFNTTFTKIKEETLQQAAEHGCYGVDDRQYQPRQLADYQRAHAQIDEEIKQTQRLFGGAPGQPGGFNNTLFNQAFEHQQAQYGLGPLGAEGALTNYQAPQAQGGAIYATTAFTELGQQGAQKTVTSGTQFANYEGEGSWHQQAAPNASSLAPLTTAPYASRDTALRPADIEKRIKDYRNFDAKTMIHAPPHIIGNGTNNPHQIAAIMQYQGAIGAPAVYQDPSTMALPMLPPPTMAMNNGSYASSMPGAPASYAPSSGTTDPTVHSMVPISYYPPATQVTPLPDYQSNAANQFLLTQQMLQMEQAQQMNRITQMNQAVIQEQVTLLKTLNQVLNQHKGSPSPNNYHSPPPSQPLAEDLAARATDNQALEKELQELRRLVKIQDELLKQIDV